MSRSADLLKISVRDLTDEGTVLDGEVQAEELDIAGDDRITVAAPFEVQLHVGTVRGDVLCQGTGQAHLRCRCDRCLTFFDYDIEDIEICHLYQDPVEDEVDLTEGVREDILLAFPLRTVCREDCRGLCSGCGQNLNVRGCECQDAPESSSPWSALDGFKLPDGGQK